MLLSKDFGPLLADQGGLRTALERYEQVCAQFTITGLGGSWWSRVLVRRRLWSNRGRWQPGLAREG